jgi:hypothetical protein
LNMQKIPLAPYRSNHKENDIMLQKRFCLFTHKNRVSDNDGKLFGILSEGERKREREIGKLLIVFNHISPSFIERSLGSPSHSITFCKQYKAFRHTVKKCTVHFLLPNVGQLLLNGRTKTELYPVDTAIIDDQSPL